MPLQTKQEEQLKNPFRLGLSSSWGSWCLEKLLGLNTLAKYYDARPTRGAKPASLQVDEFLAYTLEVLGANPRWLNLKALHSLPKEGPVIFVSNHPLGGLEGVAMSSELRKIRPDLKVLTNQLLLRILEFADLFIGVDVLSKDAAEKNAKGIRELVKHLRKGGALLVYPAGQVSAVDTRDFYVRDIEWSIMVGRLVRQFQAISVPLFVHGKNSRLFYLAGLIHPLLRTVLLPRELANNSRKVLPITVGEPIFWESMQPLASDQEIINCLRAASDALGKS